MAWLRYTVAVLVTVVWAVLYLATVFDPNTHAPPELSGVMLAVVTWLFGTEIRHKLTSKGGSPDDRGA